MFQSLLSNIYHLKFFYRLIECLLAFNFCAKLIGKRREIMPNKKSPYTFKNGLKDGLPIGLGYLSVSFAFGVQASMLGIPLLLSVFTSMTNLTSAGQLAGITVMTSAGTLVSLILTMMLTQLVINARYFLMSVSLTQKVDESFTISKRILCSFAVTDEIFAVAMSKPKAIGTRYFYGLALLPYVCWALGTLLGAVAGNILPSEIKEALGIALYAMFIAIIVPPSMKKLGVLITVLLSAGISCAFTFIPVINQLDTGIVIVISALVSAVLMAIFFPVKQESLEDSDNLLEEKSEVENE